MPGPTWQSSASGGQLVDSVQTVADGAVNFTFSTIASGEIAGSATAAQCPTVACKLVRFKALASNAGKVYLGVASTTKADGTTDVTTGLELSAGDDTGWIPVSNVNLFYRICDNAGDDLTYLALVS